MSTKDAAVRATAFAWLSEQVARHGDVLPWSLLHAGFEFDGQRVPLLSQQGIFKPKLCELPLSIRTSVDSSYADELVDDRLAYAYMGSDPGHWQNAGLRRAFHECTAYMGSDPGHLHGMYGAAAIHYLLGNARGQVVL